MKWDGARAMPAPDPLPMWVADMDVRAPQPVIDALLEASRQGVFGYVRANHAHFAAAINGLGAGLRVLSANSHYLAWMDCRG